MEKPPIRGKHLDALDQLLRVSAVLDRLQGARRVEQVERRVVDGLRELLPLDLCAFLSHSDTGEGRGLVLRAWNGSVAGLETPLERGIVPLPPGQRSRVVSLDEKEVVTDVPLHGLRERGLTAVLRVALLHQGRVLGELVLGRSTAAPFAADEIRLAELVAGCAALSLSHAHLDADHAGLVRRFEAERAILESVLDQMPAGVLLADVPSGRIIAENPQIEVIWGKTLRHSSRISDYALWGGLDPDGGPLDPEEWPLAKAIRRGAVIRGEALEIERADGSRRVVRMSASPVADGRGRPLAAVAVVQDMTHERRRERRLRFLENATRTLNASIELGATLEAVVDAVVGPFADWAVLYRWDGDRLRAEASAHESERFAGAVEAFRDRELVVPGDHPLRRAIDRREPLQVTRHAGDPARAVAGDDPRLGRAADRLGCDHVLILPLIRRDRCLGVMVVVRDQDSYAEEDVHLMTELAPRAALAVDNAELYEQARTADRDKSNFLAVMSHEFRTPLSAILGYADILTAGVHGELNPIQVGHLQRVKASVRHLSHLVDEILSFASMEAGRERVTRRSTDMTALVAGAVSIMEPIAEAAGLALNLALPDIPLEVQTDASKVRQIVINLVSNALKYTAEGGVTVELARDGALVLCRVTDTGPGIAPEHMDRVFEPFWQVEQDEGRITGTGLGLAVARRLARLLGGDVVLDSAVGKGSRFTLLLPTGPGVAADPSR